jgi:ribosomal protein S13
MTRNLTEDEEKEYDDLINNSHNIESEYAREDEEMCLRLVKVRTYMWS